MAPEKGTEQEPEVGGRKVVGVDCYPLDPEALRCLTTASISQAGQMIPSLAANVICADPTHPVRGRDVYFLTPDEMALLKRRYPAWDWRTPQWQLVVADLVLAGRAVDAVNKCNVMVLLRWLREADKADALGDSIIDLAKAQRTSVTKTAQTREVGRMSSDPDSSKWLSYRIDLDFERTSLDNVLKYMAEVLPSVSIIVDPDIAAAGIDLSIQVVDFKGKAVAVGDVLDMILGSYLAYVPRDGHLFITTTEKLYLSLECKTYTVGVRCPWQELLNVVERTVNNAADRYVARWADEGGTAALEYGNGVLIVTQTYRGHQRIADLLERLGAHGFFDADQQADETCGPSGDTAKKKRGGKTKVGHRRPPRGMGAAKKIKPKLHEKRRPEVAEEVVPVASVQEKSQEQQGIWSRPMPLTEMALRIFKKAEKWRAVKKVYGKLIRETASRKLHQIRLDTFPKNIQDLFERA